MRNRIPIPARAWPTKKRRKLLDYGKHVYSKRKTNSKKKMGKYEETKRKRKTHGTNESSKYSRARVKFKVSKPWTKQKCHSAGQRNLDDDDGGDDDLESVSEV